jgi:hypothetical protein
MRRGPDGRFYSQTGLGPSLLAAPFFGIGEAISKFSPARYNGFWTRFGVAALLNPLVTALTAALLYSFCVLLGYPRRAALHTTIGFGFATIAWWFTKTAFTEPLAALLLLISFLGLYRFQTTGSYAWLLVSGTAMGLALLTRFQLLLVVPLFLIYLLWALWKDVQARAVWRVLRVLLLWSVPIAAAILLIGWYNWTRFSSPLESGYSPYARMLGLPRAERLYGLLFSPGKSLFWYSPPLIAGVIGLWWFGIKHPRETFLVGAFAISQLLFYGSYELWHGDSGWGPRFLAPAIPFLMLPFAEMAARVGVRWFAYFTIALGLVVQIPALLVNTSTIILRTPQEKPWDTLWMADWRSAPIAANWSLLWERLTATDMTIPELPPLPNDRFIWFNDPFLFHRADVWWWYLPHTQMEGTAVYATIGALVISILILLFFTARALLTTHPRWHST